MYRISFHFVETAGGRRWEGEEKILADLVVVVVVVVVFFFFPRVQFHFLSPLGSVSNFGLTGAPTEQRSETDGRKEEDSVMRATQ